MRSASLPTPPRPNTNSPRPTSPSTSTITTTNDTLTMLHQTLARLDQVVNSLVTMVQSTNDRIAKLELSQSSTTTTSQNETSPSNTPSEAAQLPKTKHSPSSDKTTTSRRSRTEEQPTDSDAMQHAISSIKTLHKSITNPSTFKPLLQEYRMVLKMMEDHQYQSLQAAAAPPKKPKHQK